MTCFGHDQLWLGETLATARPVLALTRPILDTTFNLASLGRFWSGQADFRQRWPSRFWPTLATSLGLAYLGHVGPIFGGLANVGQRTAPGPPKIARFCFPSPVPIFIFFFSLWVSSRGILVAFWLVSTSNVLALGLSCGSPRRSAGQCLCLYLYVQQTLTRNSGCVLVHPKVSPFLLSVWCCRDQTRHLSRLPRLTGAHPRNSPFLMIGFAFVWNRCMALLLPATSEPNSFITLCFKDIFGGVSSLIALQSFLQGKINIDPIHFVLMFLPCILHVLSVTLYFQIDRVRILVFFVHEIFGSSHFSRNPLCFDGWWDCCCVLIFAVFLWHPR